MQAALRSTCAVVYGIGDIVSIGLYNSEYNLQNALVVGIGKQRESTDDIDVHVSVRGSKFWVPARHLEMVTKKPMVSQSNPSLCLVSTLEDNRAFLKRFAVHHMLGMSTEKDARIRGNLEQLPLDPYERFRLKRVE